VPGDRKVAENKKTKTKVLSVLESIVEYGSYASRRGWGQARS
jgi:hypothetical protein